MALPAINLVGQPMVPDSATSAARLSPRYYRRWSCSALSMNGCDGSGGGGRLEPVEICETRVLPAVRAPEMAMPQLRSAVAALNAGPPAASSGIIRLEVPIMERSEAIGWLQAQDAMPRCFFSGRGEGLDAGLLLVNGGPNHNGSPGDRLVSVAGVGSAVYFRRLDPFALDDWRGIKRFLSRSCPFIRAYGAIRFDAGRYISSEWKEFGSFYFLVPQVEFNELKESSKLALNIAWDESLSWPWSKAINRLQSTLHQISPFTRKFPKEFPVTTITSSSHIPTRISWEIAVKQALKFIRGQNSELLKVVLARSSKIVTNTDIDPVTLLACLMVEGQNAYQFCIQPPTAPAFIGNTPEQLFHRKHLDVSSEALAGTRARGISRDEDLQIEQDLLLSPKDDIEFTIVRDSIRRKLEAICNEVVVEPSKAIRKLPRVQHLSAQLTAKLRSELDEFNILSSLHPSPAVCGLPTEEARKFIADSEIFDRGMYAGPVGWFGGNESEFAVGIRSALVDKGVGTFIYAGAGIVEGTNPSSEWEELELKASQFTKLLEHGKLTFPSKIRQDAQCHLK